jgi:hypothetical protein
MTELSIVQLKFEQLVQDVASKDIFSDQAGCVEALRTIEKGLHKLIAEYEAHRPTIAAAISVPVADLPRLQEYLARHSDDPNGYKAGFFPITSSLWELRRVIRADILKIAGLSRDSRKIRALNAQAEWRYS